MISYEQILLNLCKSDERFVVLTAENRALIRNLTKELGRRFIDTGITEQTMVGMAAGLALQGRIPVIHALSTFLTLRAFEFIRTDVGIPQLPVKLTGFVPGFLSDANGPTHQAIEDVALMRGIPGMNVFCPADEEDMLLMLESIWNAPNPVYLRANTRKSTYKHEPFEIGKAETVSLGKDVNILVYGILFEQALVAKQLLEEQGLSVGLVNMRSLKPVDENAIINACEADLVVTLEDHFQTGGLYTIVAETLLKNTLTAQVMPIDLNEKWFRPALLNDVLEYEGFTGSKIASRILHRLERGAFSNVSVDEKYINVFDE